MLTKENVESEKQGMASIEKTASPYSSRSLKELFIVFFVFSFAGHYLEVVWAWVKYFAVGSSWYPKINDLIPLAAPYGLGAVALITIIWPIMRNRKIRPVSVFVLSAIVAGIVEALSGLIVVLLYGKNYFWDYSGRIFNFFGLTCLSACLMFGAASILFLYYIYPHFEKLFENFKKNQISMIFWVLFVAYFVNMSLVIAKDFF